MSDPYLIQAVSYKDVKSEVLNLWDQNGYSDRHKILDWMYGDFTSRPEMHSSFFTLRHDDQIVGCCGVIERKIKLIDETVKSAYPNNFLVDTKHRSLGPALQVQKNVISLKDYKLIYAIPNDKSDGVLKRVGYKPIGKMERWVLILKTEKYLKKLLKHPAYAKLLAVLADILLSVKYVFKGINLKKISVEVIENFDDRFNNLWKKANKNYAIIGDRSTEYLKWRFTDYPINDNKIFILRDYNEKLIAYLVFYEQKTGFYIEDLFAEKEEMIVYLLNEFLKYSKKHNRDSISFRFFGDPAIGEVLDKVGFKKRSDSNSVLIFSKSGQESIYEKNNWFLTAADMDV